MPIPLPLGNASERAAFSSHYDLALRPLVLRRVLALSLIGVCAIFLFDLGMQQRIHAVYGVTAAVGSLWWLASCGWGLWAGSKGLCNRAMWLDSIMMLAFMACLGVAVVWSPIAVVRSSESSYLPLFWMCIGAAPPALGLMLLCVEPALIVGVLGAAGGFGALCAVVFWYKSAHMHGAVLNCFVFETAGCVLVTVLSLYSRTWTLQLEWRVGHVLAGENATLLGLHSKSSRRALRQADWQEFLQAAAVPASSEPPKELAVREAEVVADENADAVVPFDVPVSVMPESAAGAAQPIVRTQAARVQFVNHQSTPGGSPINSRMPGSWLGARSSVAGQSPRPGADGHVITIRRPSIGSEPSTDDRSDSPFGPARARRTSSLGAPPWSTLSSIINACISSLHSSQPNTADVIQKLQLVQTGMLQYTSPPDTGRMSAVSTVDETASDSKTVTAPAPLASTAFAQPSALDLVLLAERSNAVSSDDSTTSSGSSDTDPHAWSKEACLSQARFAPHTLLYQSVTNTNGSEFVAGGSWRPAAARFSAACDDVLEHCLEWDWDVRRIVDVSGHRPLELLTMHIVDRLGLLSSLGIYTAAFQRYVNIVERTYCYIPSEPNAYHTALHAADVLQAVSCFIVNIDSCPITRHLSPLDQFALVFAAIIHDYRHAGVGNNYLVNDLHPLAIAANDHSVLENFSLAEAFRLLRDPVLFPDWCGLLSLGEERLRTFRSCVIDCVLATDLSVELNGVSLPSRPCERFRDDGSPLRHPLPDATLSLCILLLKAADVSHPMRDIAIHARWTEAIQFEFFKQGDMEAQRGLPLSAHCEAAAAFSSRSQLQFISDVVQPVLKQLAEFHVGFEHMEAQLHRNRRHWSDRDAASFAFSKSHATLVLGRGDAMKRRVLIAEAPGGDGPGK